MAGSLDFNGVSDRVDFSLGANLSGALTVLMIAKLDATANDSDLLANFSTGGAGFVWGVSVGGAMFWVNLGVSNAGAGPRVTAGNWCVLAVTKASGTTRPRGHIYDFATRTWTHSDFASSVVNPASQSGGTTSVGNYATFDDPMDGQVALVAEWTSALTDANIETCVTWDAVQALTPAWARQLDGTPPFSGQTAISGTTHSSDEPSLGFWPSSGATVRDVVSADIPIFWPHLDERSGTSAADAMGGAAGTYTGGYTLNQSSLVNDANPSVDFGGSSGYVSFPDSAALDRGDVFTLECWIRPDAFLDRSGNPCVFMDKGTNAYIFRFTTAGDGTLLLRRNGVADICTSTIRLSTGVTYHVVATKNGATAKIYVNGVDVTSARTNSTMTNNTNALGIGVADVTVGPANGFFDGLLDEPAIYNYALSPARVLAHYNAGVAAPPSASAMAMII